MPLHLSPATPSHAPRIAAIHMAAFSTNPLLLAQFPTPALRNALQTCIATKALADIRDPKIAVLVVADDDGGGEEEEEEEIVSFAKWSLPVARGEAYVETAWGWPEGTELGVLEGWGGLVEGARGRVVGGADGDGEGEGGFYCLTFIGTDPLHERRGAASLLLKWGLQHCILDNVPAYLESTVEAAPLYERHGFTAAEKISMVLHGRGGGESVVYEEICFVFRPGAAVDMTTEQSAS